MSGQLPPEAVDADTHDRDRSFKPYQYLWNRQPNRFYKPLA
ncbi:hypothetical protein QUB60_01350 [Microcoleus sp. A2-C5]|nr:hypothetical protein [Lyngbya sp. CCAP 1446/10]